MVNASGQYLQIFPPNATGGFDTSTTTNLHLDTSQQAAQATTLANLNINLPSNATAPTAAFNPTDSTTYNQSVPFTAYDSLGSTHSATAYFVKTGTANTWNVYLNVDGTSTGAAQQVSFDTSGALVSPANGQLSFGAVNVNAGANPLQMTLDLSKATQSGNSFASNSVHQNGYPTGTLSSIGVSSTGVVSATYSNGESTQLGQVALANFANPQGLHQVNNTNWTASYASGDPVLGAPGSGLMGSIQSGALESSNTADLTAQLVNMIKAQQNYQANAKVISTDDQLTKTVINMTN